MNCTEVAAADLPARYVAGHLSEAETEAYEAHYFECDACFRELEIVRAAGKVLAADARPAGRAGKPAALPRWLAVAAALMAATTVALWLNGNRQTVPDEVRSFPSPGMAASPSPAADTAREAELVRMARFDPPAYDPPRLRNAAAQRAAFDRAMAPYRAGDHAKAVPALEDFQRRYPADVRAAFYLGVSLLATGRTEDAVGQLERVRAAADPAYEEDAHYLLAKAAIRRGDLPAAVAALDRTIALEGDLLGEARALRDRVIALQRP